MKKIFAFLLLPLLLTAQTIEEKKAQLKPAAIAAREEQNFKREMQTLKEKRKALYQIAESLIENKEDLEPVLQALRSTQKEIRTLESQNTKNTNEENEPSLWHHPHITLGHLVADYAQDFLYVLSPQAAESIVSLSSHLSIESESWDELIEQVASSMGFQVIPLNGFTKQIIASKEIPATECSLVCSLQELELLPLHKRVCYVIDGKKNNLQLAHQLLQKLALPDQIKFCAMPESLIVMGAATQVKQLLSLWEKVGQEHSDYSYKLIPLERLTTQDAQKALNAWFNGVHDRPQDPKVRTAQIGEIKIIPISGQFPAVFVIGSQNQIKEAEDLLKSLQNQNFDPQEKVMFCYTCQNSKAEEIAKVLKQVYQLMQKTSLSDQTKGKQTTSSNVTTNYTVSKDDNFLEESNIPSLIVNPGVVSPGNGSQNKDTKQQERDNFIVDSKSGTIIMVIEKEAEAKIRDLLKKLDTPKKMVQIEVLLFEKRVTSEDRIGLNLLKTGSVASNQNGGGISWNDPDIKPPIPGILAFFISHAESKALPAFDLVYNFLLSQEEIQINACPSVITINQTPAKIALVDEISVNNGAVIVDVNDSNSGFVKDSYSRAQYGITIEITPTIHFFDECGSDRFITLETDITFDTTKPSKVSRPEVTRRNIKNQVRIADGETVVLGGLRRKMNNEVSEKIPFLGEIPLLGNLFSQNTLSDSQTEMFIFLTPHIIDDEQTTPQKMTLSELFKRPGDSPCLIDCVLKAKENEKQALFTGSVKLMLGGH